jgi:DNA-binding transcriptional ArsR family regulator
MLIESEQSSQEMGEVFERVANYFALLAEPMRLKILYALCDEERPVTDIVSIAGSTQANVSRHLNLLYRAKLLLRRKEGTQVFYRIADRNALMLCKTVCADVISDIEQHKAVKKLRIEAIA